VKVWVSLEVRNKGLQFVHRVEVNLRVKYSLIGGPIVRAET
jgi:hypothetical protein